MKHLKLLFIASMSGLPQEKPLARLGAAEYSPVRTPYSTLRRKKVILINKIIEMAYKLHLLCVGIIARNGI